MEGYKDHEGYVPSEKFGAITVGAINGGLVGLIAGICTSFAGATGIKRVLPAMYKYKEEISKTDVSQYRWYEERAPFERLLEKTWASVQLHVTALTQLACSAYAIGAITNPDIFVKEGVDAEGLFTAWALTNAASLIFEVGSSIYSKKATKSL
jgi:hypothetical protein